MQQRNVTNFVTSLARFKFNGDGFQICNTEDDRCTIETCLEKIIIKESCYVYAAIIILFSF